MSITDLHTRTCAAPQRASHRGQRDLFKIQIRSGRSAACNWLASTSCRAGPILTQALEMESHRPLLPSLSLLTPLAQFSCHTGLFVFLLHTKPWPNSGSSPLAFLLPGLTFPAWLIPVNSSLSFKSPLKYHFPWGSPWSSIPPLSEFPTFITLCTSPSQHLKSCSFTFIYENIHVCLFPPDNKVHKEKDSVCFCSLYLQHLAQSQAL